VRGVWAHARTRIPARHAVRPNDLSASRPPALSVLVASNRPSVHAFIAEHTRLQAPMISIVPMPMDQDALEGFDAHLEQASAVMVDIGPDPDGGVRFCAAVHNHRPGLRIVAIVCCPKPTLGAHIQQLVGAGVHDILDAEAGPADILSALAAGDLTSQGVRMQLHRSYGPQVADGKYLDDAERQLLELNAAGASIKEIGAALNLCERAVGNHFDRLRLKLGVRNRQELAAWGGAHGLYQPVPARDPHAPVG
jgi:DNA-binding NarL/FixJ family response regulator